MSPGTDGIDVTRITRETLQSANFSSIVLKFRIFEPLLAS